MLAVGDETTLRKSLTLAGITESVVVIVEKYISDPNMPEEDKKAAIDEMKGTDEWKRIEDSLRKAGL